MGIGIEQSRPGQLTRSGPPAFFASRLVPASLQSHFCPGPRCRDCRNNFSAGLSPRQLADLCRHQVISAFSPQGADPCRISEFLGCRVGVALLTGVSSLAVADLLHHRLGRGDLGDQQSGAAPVVGCSTSGRAVGWIMRVMVRVATGGARDLPRPRRRVFGWISAAPPAAFRCPGDRGGCRISGLRIPASAFVRRLW